jgi:hypothetical protein
MTAATATMTTIAGRRHRRRVLLVTTPANSRKTRRTGNWKAIPKATIIRMIRLRNFEALKSGVRFSPPTPMRNRRAVSKVYRATPAPTLNSRIEEMMNGMA